MLQSEAHVQHRSTSFSTSGPGAEVGLPAHGASGCLKVLRCAKAGKSREDMGRWAKDVAETTPVEMDSGPGR